MAVGDRTQEQLVAQDNAAQGALNAFRADEIRAENRQAFQDALETRETNETIRDVVGAVGDYISRENSTPEEGATGAEEAGGSGKSSSGTGTQTGSAGGQATAQGPSTSPVAGMISAGGAIMQSVADGIVTGVGGVADWVSEQISTSANTSSGKIKIGNAEMTQEGFAQSYAEMGEFFVTRNMSSTGVQVS